MPTRRSLIVAGMTGWGAKLFARGAAAAPTPTAGKLPPSQSGTRYQFANRPYLQPPEPITADDFKAIPGVKPLPQSAAYDPKSPHLFAELRPRFATRLIKSRFIPMRDGVRLSTDFYVPLGASLPLPVILIRTPYSKSRPRAPLNAIFPEQGFVLAVQDVRGRYESEGCFIANHGIEREDGYDTLDWLAAQSWCNGRIGAWGTSYLGETAARLSAMRHPNHRCSLIMFDGSNSAGIYQNGGYTQGGITLLRDLFGWFRDAVPAISYGPPAHVDREAWFSQPFSQNYATQPVKQPEVDLREHLRTLPVFSLLDRSGAAPSEFREMMLQSAHPRSAYFDAQGFLTEADHFDVPALHIAGLLERGDSGFANFNLFRTNGLSKLARENQFLMFVPTPHSGYMSGSEQMVWGVRNLGDTRFPYLKTFVDWFGRWLRDDATGVEKWPKVRHFLLGANEWRTASTWPPADITPLRMYLRSGGGLSFEPPLGEEPPDRFMYDPANPCPSEPPGAESEVLGDGYADFASLEARSDVLVYSSERLAESLELSGAVSLFLQVSSSAKDTDFAGLLLEVDEQGRALNVTHGIARSRYRNGLDQPLLMEPGRVYELPIDLWFASIRFAKGRRIRLHISSSRFPLFDRNLNTGGDNYTESQWVIAENRVHHSAAHPSYLLLPQRRLGASIT